MEPAADTRAGSAGTGHTPAGCGSGDTERGQRAQAPRCALDSPQCANKPSWCYPGLCKGRNKAHCHIPRPGRGIRAHTSLAASRLIPSLRPDGRREESGLGCSPPRDPLPSLHRELGCGEAGAGQGVGLSTEIQSRFCTPIPSPLCTCFRCVLRSQYKMLGKPQILLFLNATALTACWRDLIANHLKPPKRKVTKVGQRRVVVLGFSRSKGVGARKLFVSPRGKNPPDPSQAANLKFRILSTLKFLPGLS